jgi:hypothetical protein
MRGIWIKLPTGGNEGLNLFMNKNWKRNYMIHKYKYSFKFEKLEESFNEVELWIN